MPFSSDPEGKRLPIKLDSTSNGEFVPIMMLVGACRLAPRNPIGTALLPLLGALGAGVTSA